MRRTSMDTKARPGALQKRLGYLRAIGIIGVVLVTASMLCETSWSGEGKRRFRRLRDWRAQIEQVEMEVMLVGGEKGGKVEAGELAYIVVEFRNLSDEVLYVPLYPVEVMKGAEREDAGEEASYGEGGAGVLLPEMVFQFEQLDGTVVQTVRSVLFHDISELFPDGYTEERAALIPAPEAPGTYRLRILVDNTPLSKPRGGNETMDIPKDAFFRKEILLEDIVVK